MEANPADVIDQDINVTPLADDYGIEQRDHLLVRVGLAEPVLIKA